MIKQENININQKEFVKTYSDTYYIKQLQTGVIYAEAIDIYPCSFSYEETDELLPSQEEQETTE